MQFSPGTSTAEPAHARSRGLVARLLFAGVISRRELFFWVACILLANQLFSFQAESGQPQSLAQILLSKSIFYYLAWYVVVTSLLTSGSNQPASGFDAALAVAIGAINAVPVLSSGWFASTAASLLLLIAGRNDKKLGAAGAVLLALAINGYWAPKLFSVFSYYLLRADAALVGAALAATQPGMSWDETIVGQLGGHSVLIFGPCSSFHNISLGLLCWISIAKLFRTSWVREDIAVALAVCAAVILLNATRLYLMALSSEHYAYWHEGPGEQLVAWATTMLVVSISLWGALRLGRCK